MILALLLQAAASASPAPSSASGPLPVPWAVTSRVDGARRSTTTSAWSSDNRARLVVRCDASGEKIVSIQFIPRAGFEPALPHPVSIKADEDGWLGANWQFPGTGAFISEDTIVTNLAVVIAHGKAIRVRAMTLDNQPVEASFAGPGEAPVRAVLGACGYQFGVSPSRSAVPLPVAPRDPATKPADPDDDQ